MPSSNMTKRSLATSMKELMSQKPFSKISVGDICESCGLNRKSFYYHFQDKYDLVNWIFHSEFFAILHATPISSPWEILERLCNYLYDNRAFYRSALAVHGQNSLQEYFQEVARPLIIDALTEGLPPDNADNDALVDFSATFYIEALLCSITRWLNDRNPMPPEVFYRKLTDCLLLGSRRLMDENPNPQKTL